MKPLLILGFALTVSFLAPLAQAAPAGRPAPEHIAPPQAAPERHEPDRQPRHDSPTVINVQAPDSDDSQDYTPDDDDSYTYSNASYGAHYTMDDLVDAMQNMDSSY